MIVRVKFNPEEEKKILEKNGFIFYETDDCYIWEKKQDNGQTVEHIKYYKEKKTLLVSSFKLTESGYQEAPLAINYDILSSVLNLLVVIKENKNER